MLIADGVIESVNPENVPQDAEVIELGDQTLLPGLIDMHTHLTADYFTGFAPGIHELGPKQGIADGVDEVTKAVRCQAKHGVRVIKVCATGGVFWDEWSVVSPRRRKQMEPREQAIEAALAPGSFISYKRQIRSKFESATTQDEEKERFPGYTRRREPRSVRFMTESQL